MRSPVREYQNPIIPGFNPDPSICRVGDDYFLVTSTFEYFPGIPIYHSKDLVQWKLIGHVLTRRSQLDMRTTEPSGGVWAPTLRFHNNRFYVLTGCTQRFRPHEWDIVIPRGFYVSTDDIWTPNSWSEPVFFDTPGIDQDLFFDTDDKVYLSAVHRILEPGVEKHGFGFATFTVEIDLPTGRCLSQPRWNCISKFGNGIAEGPHIFKRNGYYYMSTAEGGTEEGHQQWIRRSREGPFGPWEEGPQHVVNPVIFNEDDPFVRNTGHLDYIKTADGSHFAVFLGVRPQGEQSNIASPLGRETFLAPVEWIDDWPVVNQRQRIGLKMHAKGLPQPSQSPSLSHRSWRDEFSEPELQLGWYHQRTPLKKDYSLQERPGFLNLYGSAYRIDDSECPSMLLQKQTELNCDWRVALEFTPSRTGKEAGTAIWWSQYAYASIGVRKVESGLAVVFRGYNEATDKFEENSHEISSAQEVELIIQARSTKYELFFSSEDTGRVLIKLGEITSSALTVKRPGKESPNTGSHFAIYAQGDHEIPCLEPASFRFAEWTRVD